MRLKSQQTRYVATKIAIDLANASYVVLPKGKDAVVEATKKIIDENLAKERALDEKIKNILNENDEEIEFQRLDEKQLFFMIKKKLAPESGIIMDYDDRYNDLSHSILDELYENYLVEYTVNENQVKNIIFRAFKAFSDAFEKIDSFVYKRIRNMKREIVPGSQEYELVYDKLYQEELSKRGML